MVEAAGLGKDYTMPMTPAVQILDEFRLRLFTLIGVAPSPRYAHKMPGVA